MILVCSDVSWTRHIEETVAKANRTLGLVKRICKNMHDQAVRKVLFCALVRPILENASNLWSPYTIKHKRLVENEYIYIHRTRNYDKSNYYRIIKHKQDYFRNSFVISSVVLWNTLPSHVKYNPPVLWVFSSLIFTSCILLSYRIIYLQALHDQRLHIATFDLLIIFIIMLYNM